jgi:hypothetical protein
MVIDLKLLKLSSHVCLVISSGAVSWESIATASGTLFSLISLKKRRTISSPVGRGTSALPAVLEGSVGSKEELCPASPPFVPLRRISEGLWVSTVGGANWGLEVILVGPQPVSKRQVEIRRKRRRIGFFIHLMIN